MTQEIVTVTSSHVSCEGNGPVSGHPKVYLTIKLGQTKVVCPYCSKTFVLAEGAGHGHGH